MGLRNAASRIGTLQERVSRTMTERNIERRDVLKDFTDEQLHDLDAILQIAYFMKYRQESSSRAEKALDEVIRVIEEAASDIEGSEHRSEDMVARAQAAVGRISESHRRAMPRLDSEGTHEWFKQFNKY